MKILLTRRLEMNAASGEAAANLGFECISLPLSVLEDTRHQITDEPYSGLIFTSKAALDVLEKRSCELKRLIAQNLPLYCVGKKTAAASATLGFSNPAGQAATSELLAEKIVAKHRDLKRPLLYLAGKDRFADLETKLAVQNIKVKLAEIYVIKLVDPGREKFITALNDANNGVAMLFSARTATHLFQLCETYGVNFDNKLRGFVAISNNVAKAVERYTNNPIWIAERPDQASMLDVLQKLQ